MSIEIISSRKNTYIANVRALASDGAYRREQGQFLCDGIKTLREAVAFGAEIVPAAIADARENARRNGIGNVEFFCGDASAVAADFAARGLRPDVICVDPPRKGLSPDVVSAAARMQPQRIVYVSCDPATLARDVKLFAQEGYGAVRAAAVDMFPGTANIESVVRLERTK